MPPRANGFLILLVVIALGVVAVEVVQWQACRASGGTFVRTIGWFACLH